MSSLNSLLLSFYSPHYIKKRRKRVSMGWCLLRLSVNFFQLRLKKVKNQFPCFKELHVNSNKPVFKVLRIISELVVLLINFNI